MVKAFFGHLRNILVHKYWVYYFGRKIGLPWLRCVLHDMSKFSPVEFWESVKYYRGTSSPIPACKAENGYSLAWQHHKGHNPHHYEYWTDNYDLGTTVIKMPYDCVMEMIADWCAAGRTYQKRDWSFESQCEWWATKKTLPNELAIHPETIALIDKFFDKGSGDDLDTILNEWRLNYFVFEEDYDGEI